MAEEIKFQVGEKYENMKGVFEVIAIRRDSMDIRWENGEEIDTSIDLQRRIIERMRFEKKLEEAEKKQKSKGGKASASKGGKQFSGLEESDFSDSVSKTTWRGRGQLGGAVATLIKSSHFKFNSWAVLRKSEVSWMDINRQKQESLKDQAKFFVRVEEANLYYGIQFFSPEGSNSKVNDWQVLMNWLEKSENVSWLIRKIDADSLVVRDVGKKGFTGDLMPKKKRWVYVDPDNKKTNVDSIQSFLSDAAKSSVVDLRIEKKLEKDDAIGKKEGLAMDVAELFNLLMPLYDNVATRNV